MKTPKHAFTLVELLAAIAILAILMAMVFAVYNQAARAWTLGERRTEVFQNARLVMEMITRELESAIVGSNGTRAITFLADENATIVRGSTNSATIFATPPNDQIFFVSTAADSRDYARGDLTEFGYMVVFAANNAFTMRGGNFYLLRHMERMTEGTSDNPDWDIFTSVAGWPVTANCCWPDTTRLDAANKTPILENVIRFELDYETHHSATNFGTAFVQTWSNIDTFSCDYPCARPYHFGIGVPNDQRPLHVLPRAVHLRMSLIDRRTAARASALWESTGLGTNELRKLPLNVSGLTNAALRQVLQENVQTLYRTIHLRNAQFTGN